MLSEIVMKLLKRYQTSERSNARKYVQTAKRQDRDSALKAQAKVEVLQEIIREEDDLVNKKLMKDRLV